MGTDQQPRLLTTDEVAEWLAVHPMTIRRLVDERRISAIRVGHSWRFQRSAIEAYLDRNKREANNEQSHVPSGG